jgi:tyrosine-specific transport protein
VLAPRTKTVGFVMTVGLAVPLLLSSLVYQDIMPNIAN